MTTVLTIGTFDLFHVGHVELLKACRDMGDTVIVGINDDDFVERYKGRRPVVSWYDRAKVLRACRYVDKAILNIGSEDSGILIDLLRPDILAIGSDWRDRDYLGQLNVTQDQLDRWGVRIEYVERTTGVSTTALRAAVRP